MPSKAEENPALFSLLTLQGVRWSAGSESKSRASKKRKKSKQKEIDFLAEGMAAAVEAAKTLASGEIAERELDCSAACLTLLETILRVRKFLQLAT